MSKYQVRLGENVTDKIVNCGAGVYWYIDKLQSEIERLNNIINKAIEYIDNLSNEPNVFGHYGIDGNCKKYLLDILKGVDKE